MSNETPKKFIPNEQNPMPRWEKKFNKILTPFERFVNRTTTGGLILMMAALIALALANSPLAHHYLHALHVPLGLNLGDWRIEKSLHHWVNDGLMALFFFVVGLELKREMLVGELAEIRKAVLPIVAAIGGMVIPAICYMSLNLNDETFRGWGIPMATDIAFALGVIALLASRVPKALITFLVALAIVDDLGAVVVIAVFYTQDLAWSFLIAGALLTCLLIFFNMIGIRKPSVYFFVGLILWFVFLKSGVHATLAGVITAFTIPAKPKFNTLTFSNRVQDILYKFKKGCEEDESILRNEHLSGLVQTLENGVVGVQTPLQRLEHSFHKPVAFFILPVFAIFNAGVTIDFGNAFQLFNHPITLGVVFGLLFGKFVGITGASWLAIRFGLCSLPNDTSMKHIIGASMLGSIGFTMSIFIAELAFVSQPEMIIQAKLGILLSSLVAGVAGYLWLHKLGGEKSRIGSSL
ncbi:Na+/H+ antiporter NhaA [Saccharophagus degradans]|uniref:Na(+)/H(+) antiporter NhaA n=1 Tax=Saccharophagus degradans TaxID=86304 RepID=A0AAW7XBC6_9GAMM|nr:Na+/H+ antiporter NhaA [Saccharophagus degradans]MBU2984179.1 Na+/H+ antiporter NhaA [Saccharophagus degradans]MDO6424162.1 Na+/H+ antiporter NhaA [Saccharophagus degradans]MDO6608209.1 Na+/H+ antiporter NhaA [Saccharophagus degradans]WGO96738.1 Na+/H+ antiporter NhaA [Saccharophagus degradans]